MDNSFTGFQKSQGIANNLKYAGVFGNLIDDYLGELAGLNEKYIHNASRVQKRFIDPEQSSRYFDTFYQELEAVNQMFQKVKEDPKKLTGSSHGLLFL